VPAILGHSSHFNRLVINTLRLPRVLVGVFVGAELGMSGAIFQSISGNGLVSPDIIGINNGAAVTAVAAIVIFNSAGPPPLIALGGALTVGALVYALTIRRHVLSPFRLVLIGVGANAGLAAVISLLLLGANSSQLIIVNHYFFGDISGSTWTTVVELVPAAVVLLALGTALGSQLQMLQLGESVAAGLGARVTRMRVGLLLVGVALAATAVAAAGPVGFVAFIAPHIARGISRSSGKGVLPLSAAVGGALVVIADYAGQRMLEPIQIPVGILTVIVGGPYFMWLLLRASRSYVI
jgi:iron complex transport system permease protein